MHFRQRKAIGSDSDVYRDQKLEFNFRLVYASDIQNGNHVCNPDIQKGRIQGLWSETGPDNARDVWRAPLTVYKNTAAI